MKRVLWFLLYFIFFGIVDLLFLGVIGKSNMVRISECVNNVVIIRKMI